MKNHPTAQEAKLGTMLFGPIEDVLDSLFLQINGGIVREAAVRIKDWVVLPVWTASLSKSEA